MSLNETLILLNHSSWKCLLIGRRCNNRECAFNYSRVVQGQVKTNEQKFMVYDRTVSALLVTNLIVKVFPILLTVKRVQLFDLAWLELFSPQGKI